jgi:Concanavalin A-like lectin/glucanases superfamily
MKQIFSIAALVLLAAAMKPENVGAQTAYSRVVTNDAPLLYWNFDEVSGNAKEIVPIILPSTANDLTPVASATRVSHATLGDGLNLGNAASFQVGDYFIVQNIAAATNSVQGPWLLEFWMQVQGSQEFQRNNYLMNFGSAGGNAPAVLYDYVGGAQPREGVELFANGNRTGAGPIIDDQNWHHLVFAYYGNETSGAADRLDIYMDGTNAAQNIRGNFSSPLSLTRFVVGTSAPQFAGSDGFEGNLDEIALYNLSSMTNESTVTAKVSQIASNHFALAHSAQSYSQGVLADGPMLYWNFDEADGNALQLAPVTFGPVQNDLVANGGAGHVAHASINSGLGLGNAANFPAGGYFNNGLLKVPTNSVVGPWLLEFWMQAQGSLTNHPRYDYLMNFGNNAPAALFDYNGANTNGGVELFHAGRTGFGPGIEDNSWHHLLFAYYGDGVTGVADRLDIYMDGTNAAQNVRATFSSPLTLTSLVVGTSGAQFAAADGFEGRLDELALYDLGNLNDESAVTVKAADIAARHFAAAQVPVVAITRTGNQATISWSSTMTGFALQSASSLTAPQWTSLNNTPTLVNGRYQVSITITGQAQFYRLQK